MNFLKEIPAFPPLKRGAEKKINERDKFFSFLCKGRQGGISFDKMEYLDEQDEK